MSVSQHKRAMKLYLGNRQDDVLELDDDEYVSLVPSANSIGRIKDSSEKEAYCAIAWKGFEKHLKYFYYREKKRIVRITDDVYADKQAAYAAAKAYLDAESTNERDVPLRIRAGDITADIADKFYYVQPKVEYPAQDVPLDPYFLGLWLGDGVSTHNAVCNIDEEVINFLEEHATMYGLELVNLEKRPGHAGTYRTGKDCRNEIHESLKRLNLLKNKHVPDIYLENSEDVRLRILAGIIDTDGSRDKNVFDVTQKSLQVSEGVVKLCKSLGIYAHLGERKALATNGKTKEPGTYYRVHIYVNALTPVIPIRISYKRWDPKFSDRLCNGIRISVSKTQEGYRHEWTKEREQKLADVAEKYRDVHGKIQWRKMVQEEEAFTDFSPDALRANYKRRDIVGDSTQVKDKQELRSALIELIPEYLSENGRIQWRQIMDDHPRFKENTIEFLRGVIGKLSPEEDKTLQTRHKARWDEIQRKLEIAIEDSRSGPSGGIQWSKVVEKDELLRKVGVNALRNLHFNGKRA